MGTYETGRAVPAGVYFSIRHLDLRVVTDEDGVLTGKEGVPYRRSPLLAVALLAPVLGGVFVMALPLIIFTSFAQAILASVVRIRTYRAGDQVPWGVYLAVNRLAVRHVSASDEVLSGKAGARFVRVPTWLLVVASPAVGGLYVVLFPLILAGVLVSLLVHLVAVVVRRAFERHGHLAHARWEPAASYLRPEAPKSATGREPAQPSAQVVVDEELRDLEAEVAARRESERRGSA
jgi:hypothetical protein